MWERIYNSLPDVSGILLAAVGVALVFVPELVGKMRPALRWVLAGLLVVLGAAGFCSSIAQHKASDSKQNELTNKVTKLQTTVDTFGPKLDEIVNRPSSPEQRAKAMQIKRDLQVATAPTQSPTAPTQTPPGSTQPPPSVPLAVPVQVRQSLTPYDEVKKARDDVARTEIQWRKALIDLNQTLISRYKYQHVPIPDTLDDDLVDSFVATDFQFTEDNRQLWTEVVKAHDDAIALMKLTPNEVRQDLANFNESGFGRRASVKDIKNRKIPDDRYSKSIAYLSNLLEKVGDYKQP